MPQQSKVIVHRQGPVLFWILNNKQKSAAILRTRSRAVVGTQTSKETAAISWTSCAVVWTQKSKETAAISWTGSCAVRRTQKSKIDGDFTDRVLYGLRLKHR